MSRPAWQTTTHRARLRSLPALLVNKFLNEYGYDKGPVVARAIVDRKLRSTDVIETLAELFLTKGLPDHIRSDNGPEFCAKAVREWLDRLDVGPLFIEPGSPWENGYCESFNGKLRDELLNREIFYTWRRREC